MTSKLFDVIREKGVLCVFVATKDGFVVDAEADTGVDPEEPAAIASTILLRTKGVMDRLIPEHLEEEKAKVSVVCGHSLILEEINDLIIGLLYDSETLPEGMARLLLKQLRRAAEELYGDITEGE